MEENNFIKEKHLSNHAKSESMGDLIIFLEQMKKSVCKIYCHNGGHGTGFFCSIQNGRENLKFLVTNNHVLSENDLSEGKKIGFSLNNEKTTLEIYIDDSRRTFTFKNFDTTFIEINEKDKIENISFLEIDNQNFENKAVFTNMPVYLLHYPDGIEIMKASGIIQNIGEDNYNIRHLCDSDFGSSGGPLLNLRNFKVVGIHKGGAGIAKNWNMGTLLDEPIKKLKEEIEKIKNKKNDNDEPTDTTKINNNILYYNEKINDLENIYEDSDYFESKNLGAFILCTNIESLKLIIKEIIKENEKDKNIIFNLILGECDLNKFQQFLNSNKQFVKCIQNTLIYNKNREPNSIPNIKDLKILNMYDNREDVKKLIVILSSKNIKPFPLPKLIRYQDYLNKYKIFHEKISHFYGDLSPKTFKKYYKELKSIIEQEEKEKKIL